MPIISSSQRELMAVERIFTMLRLSLLRTQIIDNTKPRTTKRILAPAHIERTPSGSVIFKKDGISVASGNTLTTRAATLKGFSFLFSIIVSIIVLTFINAFMNGYGFTSKMAVGEIWADEECIQTSEYDFYYSFIEGENIKIIDHFAVTEKKLVGYQKELNLEKHKKTVYDSNQQIFGYVYSFKGKQNYYHIFISTKIGHSDEGIKINLLNEVTIKEDVIPVLHNSYFETNFELTEFYSNNNLYVVE